MPVPAAAPTKPKRPSSDLDDYEEALLWFIALLMLEDSQQLAIEERGEREGDERAVYAQALVAREAWEAAEDAEAGGEDIDDFKAELKRALVGAWGAAAGARVELMAGGATQAGYERGRWDELNSRSAVATKVNRMWRYVSALEPRTCSYCASLHGTTLPAGDTWWLTRYPPQHGRCLCSVVEADYDAVQTANPPTPPPKAEGFGRPGEEWQAPWEEFPPAIAAAARAKTSR